jgi:hypothetical protein
MTRATNPPQRSTRRAVSLALALGATGFGGCASSSWLEEKKFAPVRFPKSTLPIMVFCSDYVRSIKGEGITDAIASDLSSELGTYGIQTTVVELAGKPRSPRIELAVWNIDAGQAGATSPPSITVDCAYVSGGEQIAFVGRLRGASPSVGDSDTLSSIERVARAIAEKLTSLA